MEERGKKDSGESVKNVFSVSVQDSLSVAIDRLIARHVSEDNSYSECLILFSQKCELGRFKAFKKWGAK